MGHNHYSRTAEHKQSFCILQLKRRIRAKTAEWQPFSSLTSARQTHVSNHPTQPLSLPHQPPACSPTRVTTTTLRHGVLQNMAESIDSHQHPVADVNVDFEAETDVRSTEPLSVSEAPNTHSGTATSSGHTACNTRAKRQNDAHHIADDAQVLQGYSLPQTAEIHKKHRTITNVDGNLPTRTFGVKFTEPILVPNVRKRDLNECHETITIPESQPPAIPHNLKSHSSSLSESP